MFWPKLVVVKRCYLYGEAAKQFVTKSETDPKSATNAWDFWAKIYDLVGGYYSKVSVDITSGWRVMFICQERVSFPKWIFKERVYK